MPDVMVHLQECIVHKVVIHLSTYMTKITGELQLDIILWIGETNVFDSHA